MVGNVGAYYNVLTYVAEQRLSVGTIVEVPVGKKKSLGVIVKQVQPPEFQCKEIARSSLTAPCPHRSSSCTIG